MPFPTIKNCFLKFGILVEVAAASDGENPDEVVSISNLVLPEDVDFNTFLHSVCRATDQEIIPDVTKNVVVRQ